MPGPLPDRVRTIAPSLLLPIVRYSIVCETKLITTKIKRKKTFTNLVTANWEPCRETGRKPSEQLATYLRGFRGYEAALRP